MRELTRTKAPRYVALMAKLEAKLAVYDELLAELSPVVVPSLTPETTALSSFVPVEKVEWAHLTEATPEVKSGLSKRPVRQTCFTSEVCRSNSRTGSGSRRRSRRYRERTGGSSFPAERHGIRPIVGDEVRRSRQAHRAALLRGA